MVGSGAKKCFKQYFERLGIWVREIRTKANLPHAHLNKLLKNLEQRKLIKSVKTVGVSVYNFFIMFNCCLLLILCGVFALGLSLLGFGRNVKINKFIKK